MRPGPLHDMVWFKWFDDISIYNLLLSSCLSLFDGSINDSCCIDMIWYDCHGPYNMWTMMQWYDMIWYDEIWYDMIWYDHDNDNDMKWYDMIWYDMIWYDMMQWWYDDMI